MKPYLSLFPSKVILSVVIMLFLPVCAGAFSLSDTTPKGTIQLSTHYRTLCPGEVIQVSLSAPRFLSATARFMDRDHVFVANRDGTAFVLLALGLDTVPGIYGLDIELVFPGKVKKAYHCKIAVSKGAFPVQRIKVNKKFTVLSCATLKRIENEKRLLKTAYDSGAPAWLGRSQFILPVGGTIRNNFGERRIFNKNFRSRHRGVDIRAGKGVPVIAANSGTIALARNLYFAGNTVIIDHGAGLFSLYCHLSKISVKKGTGVTRGDKIGRVGATGRVTGPHLHWGMKLHGQYVNPLSVMALPLQ